MRDQPIEVAADAKSEAKVGDQSIEKDKAGPNGEARVDDQPAKEVLKPLQGSADIFLEEELILEMEEMQRGGEESLKDLQGIYCPW